MVISSVVANIYYLRRAQCRFRIFLNTKHERLNQYFASGVRKKDLPRLRAQCRFRIFLNTKHERLNQYFASGVRKKDLPRQAQGSKSRLKCRFDLFKMRSSEVSLSQTYLRKNSGTDRFRSSSGFYVSSLYFCFWFVEARLRNLVLVGVIEG